MKKWGWSVAVFLSSLLVTMPIGFFLALILLGPHTDFPRLLQLPETLLLCFGVLGDPDMVLVGYL